jgi:ribose/xylose/arabinose/galactoside ABC-type transport system permease subunit
MDNQGPVQVGTGAVAVRTAPGDRRSRTVQLLLQYGIVLALMILGIALSFLSPVFLTFDNLIQVLLQASINAIIALGMTFVIITAGIDLSVGSTAALSGMVAGTLMVGGMPWPLAVIAALLVGLLIGFINGFLITRLRITPFIVTLGMLSVVRGVALVYSNGRPVYGFPETFNQAFGGNLGPIPMPVVIAALVALISWFVLRQTRLGEYTYAIGGNAEATRLSGVPVARYQTIIYMICALFAALAGIVLTARLRSAEPIAATGYELDAIAATVMGGTSLFGGEGGVVGTIIGALIISTLRNGLNLLNVQSFYQQLAIGLVIILAVALDRFRQ